MEDLSIVLAQTNLVWEDQEANRRFFEDRLNGISEEVDLIVLPEMFNTGFSMESDRLAEQMDGPTISWMRMMAEKMDAVVYGSLIIEEKGHRYNRGVWMRPDGSLEHYDKRHLFRMANETDHFTAGKDRVVVELKGWRFLLQICYDLRFPVFSRNRTDYDAAIYVANWPEVRRAPWSTLLLARAIENQCWVIGVNRVGKDGNGISYSGDSALIDPYGNVHSAPEPSLSQFHMCQMKAELLPAFRKKFPVGLDADDFTIK